MSVGGSCSAGGGGGIFPGYSWFSSCPLSFLLLVVIVTLVESGPMADFGGAASESGGEMTSGTVLSSRSLSEWSSSSSSSSPTRSKRDAAIEPIQLCGYRLLEAVRGLCRGNYVGYNRRSDPDMQLQADEPMTNLDETSLDATAEEKFEYNPESLSPKQKGKLKRGNKGTSSSTLHRRYRRNIIDECCKKPCSVNDMLRYCGRN